MIKLLVIADDLTGALDTGVQISQLGVETQVSLYENQTLGDVRNSQVLVIDTETRHCTPEQAAAVVTELVEEAVEHRVPYIYKKTDSALRGNIGAELMAASKAAGIRPIPFVPAWPENGRTTWKGIHYVDGVPLGETSFAEDMLNPVTSSEVGKILESTAPARWTLADTETYLWPENLDVLIFDAETGEQVDRIGEKLERRNQLRLSAGCARLFQSIAPRICEGLPRQALPQMERKGKTLLVCGSLSSASLGQTAFAVESLGYVPVQPDGAPCSGSRTVLPEGTRLVLRSSIGVPEDIYNLPPNRREEQARRTAEAIGVRTKEIIDSGGVNSIIVFGGDTLYAIIRALGINRLRPVEQVEEGVVWCLAEYRGASINFITKAGSFGKRDLVGRLQRKLENERSGSMYIEEMPV